MNIYENDMFVNAKPIIFGFAKENRKKMTPAEIILWDALKDKKLNGWKFRKQHPIGSFILDFYCHSAKLGVELDGGYHNIPEQIASDTNRTAILENAGIAIIRFRNEQITNELNKVLKEILEKLNSRLFDPKTPAQPNLP